MLVRVRARIRVRVGVRVSRAWLWCWSCHPRAAIGAGGLTPRSFSVVAPAQESWAAPDIQGLSSFPFLERVIFPPFAMIQAGRTRPSRELLTVCSNQN